MTYCTPSRRVRLSPGAQWLTRYPIAHRGLHAPGIPENTLPAFALAIQHGYAIELDVQWSRDGYPVVFHDTTLERLTMGYGAVAAHTLAHLQRSTVGGTPYRIPSLAAVLAYVRGRVPLVIEVKQPAMDTRDTRPVAAVCDMLRGYRGAVAVQSFNPWVVLWLRRSAPHVLRGQIAGDLRGSGVPIVRRVLLQTMLLNHITCPHFIAYDVRALPSPWVWYWRRRGVPVLAWTVRTARAWQVARAHADNVIFERVAARAE